MSDSIIERLRHHAQDERNTAFARSTMREAEGHIERLSNDLFDALDCKNGTGPTALSLVVDERDSLRAELDASRERFAKSSAAFEREQGRADAAEVRAETAETALAASREREARMRAMIADDGHAMTFQSLGQYRTSLLRALAEGAQG